MGASSGTVLEITVISCENLRVTEDPYVVVRAESLKCCTTKMAKDSGSNKTSLFSWNEKLMLNMPMHARSITFEVQCNRFKGFRPAGVARIAVSDFLGGGVSGNFMHVELPVEGLGRERNRGESFRGEGGGSAGEGDGGE